MDGTTKTCLRSEIRLPNHDGSRHSVGEWGNVLEYPGIVGVSYPQVAQRVEFKTKGATQRRLSGKVWGTLAHTLRFESGTGSEISLADYQVRRFPIREGADRKGNKENQKYGSSGN